MKTLVGILEIVSAAVICWWSLAIIGMFLLTVFKYLAWFWLVIN
ncbi:hypothetical protein [Loigolactobacillus backii]|nr:hypothetical protein [Loigolactobacillus backii]MDA5386978.1 hypothetical protein [Loigolactobacillus backii]MDA5389516.1 hypothetical protein [Loigolactobacillus backii]